MIGRSGEGLVWTGPRSGVCLLWATLQACLAAGLQAQSVGPPHFTLFDMEDGLSQSSVEALVQDASGFLWIGTRDGLNRYDGVGFRAYKHVRDDTLSLADDFIRSLAAADDGRLWVGTERGGLNLFDPTTGLGRRYPLDELGPWNHPLSTEPGRSSRTVSAIVAVADGTLLLTTDAGLARFDPGRGVPERVPTSSVPTASCAHPEGGALAGFANGVVVRVGGPATAPTPSIRLDRRITALRCGPGEAYAGTEVGGVHRLGLERMDATAVLRLDTAVVENPRVRDVLRTPDGTLWVTTPDGVYTSHPDDPDPRRVGTGDGPGTIPDPDATELLLDRTGVLWIGTWNGLASLHPLSGIIRRFRNRQGTEPGLVGAGVVSVESGPDGALWVGTIAGGVQRTGSGWREGEPSFEVPPSLRGLSDAVVFDLSFGPGGELWIAAFDRGIVRLDPSGAAQSVPIEGRDGTVVNSAAYSVFVDRERRVWAGSNDQGLLRLDARRGRFVPVVSDDRPVDLGSLRIWPIVEDSSGTLWVGAYNGGVSALSPDGRSLRRYRAEPGGLSDDRILTLHAGAGGVVWVGTEGGGLNRIDPRSGEITVYTVADGLPHDHVEAIVEDDLGHLWVSTNDGLARLDHALGTWRVFREPAGLAGNRFLANSVHETEAGELVFGGERGLTLIEPSRLGTPGEPPLVALSRLLIHGREQPLGRAWGSAGLDLAPDENFFTFEFAALDFTDPSQNRYRYRLADLDADWIEAGASNVAHYTSVPPGRYTFRVAARSSEGIWNEAGLAIPVRVRAPYHRTLWFRTGAAAAALLLVSAIWLYRMRELHRRQELRLRIAGELHDDIGANLSAIALKADMVGAGGELDPRRKEQLVEVGRLAREAALRVRETVWVVNTRYDTVAGLLAKMRDTADTVLGGQVRYTFQAPDPAPATALGMRLRQDVHLLFKEVLHNVVKHARSRTVAIDVAVTAGHLHLVVQDDGRGFAPETVGEGNGLQLMRARAAGHGGELQVDSRPGEGTRVTLRVRLR